MNRILKKLYKVQHSSWPAYKTHNLKQYSVEKDTFIFQYNGKYLVSLTYFRPGLKKLFYTNNLKDMETIKNETNVYEIIKSQYKWKTKINQLTYIMMVDK